MIFNWFLKDFAEPKCKVEVPAFKMNSHFGLSEFNCQKRIPPILNRTVGNLNSKHSVLHIRLRWSRYSSEIILL